MQSDLLNEALQLLIYGMGTVFIFLYVLVLATSGMSWFVTRFAPEPEPYKPSKRVAKANTTQVDPDVLKAIGLAVQEYRRERR
jgi:oxaloacetate decarboxylase (Na+ extruding) subunit gamma